MAEGKKYNAFSGVFTPSLLTILGVIMYMRLGWVVGEAGLLMALVIITLSHVISVTTGLSISSIATDKKIKTGGIYYILSRSLGMPMGGAIGIALFIGTALSISLYLIGFAESFLAIDYVREFLGLSADINGFRIIGTIVVVLLVVVAFISTSLAMRLQFFILIAIALSLLSIVLGFFDGNEITSNSVALFANKDHVSLEVLFAIFFPAVTGFTAGVAMSGDLQNPKTDIPRGTIFAIGVGFIVYVLLAIGMAYFIPREDLIGNYNILTQIAWIGPLVIAGVWGATLSSALGGILGGPRILQAIAKDKMSPKLFAKGYGESNEPRNALILIFVIAEAGILIGELDVIAELVSMFYLASYGFINLSYVLEKWSSSDFRPTFKIHIIFGIVGFIASFAVMFKLNTSAMFASLLIMGLLYFILKRKEIKSENGDVWQSVMGSIIQKALAKMHQKSIEERNWKPNIILFSGGTEKRAHLLNFGKSIIGRYGLLSNFDLIENPNSDLLFTKYEQSIKDNYDYDKSVFTRQQSCKNIYQGIETIAQTYGFSGVEPNTILMGWARRAKDPLRFVQMLNFISKLDLNILLLDYDKINGFGQKKQIDIWWRGSGNHGNLSLTLIKFLSNSEAWHQAKIRLLIVNYENQKMEMIRKRAEEYLENIRVDADLKIINNEIEQKPFYDIMKAESSKSDLVFLGIPEIEEGKEIEFVEQTSDLMHKIGSVVLVKASSLFKDLHLGVSDKEKANTPLEASTLISESQKEHITLVWPKNMVVAHEMRLLHQEVSQNFELYASSFFKQIENDNNHLLTQLRGIVNHTFKSIELRYSKFEPARQAQLVSYYQSHLLLKLHKLIEQYTEQQLVEQAHLFESHLPIFIQNIKTYFSNLPSSLLIYYSQNDLIKNENDTPAQRRYKWWKRLFGGKQVKYKLKYKHIVEENWAEQFETFLLDYFRQFGLKQAQFSIELRKLVKEIDSVFIALSDKMNKQEVSARLFSEQKNKMDTAIEQVEALNVKIQDSLSNEFYIYQAQRIKTLSEILNQIHPNSNLISDDEDERPKIKSLQSIIERIPSAWHRNQTLVNNASTMEIRLISLKSRVKAILYKLIQDIRAKLESDVVEVYNTYLTNLEKSGEDNDFKGLNAIAITASISSMYDEANRAFNKSFLNIPDSIEVFEDEKLNHFEKLQFSNIESSQISAKQLSDYLIKNKIEAPLIKQFEDFSKRLTESISLLNDSKRLISFASSRHGDEDDFQTIEDEPKQIFEDSKIKMQKELALVEDLMQEINLEADNLFNDISQLLSYYSFVKTASNLKQYIHKQKKQSRLGLIRNAFRHWVDYLKEQQANLIYTQSKALVLKKQLEGNSTMYSPVKMLLDLSYQLTPNENVMSQLPFYYKQLFSSNNQILHKDFWVNRAEEIKSVQSSVNRYLSGYKGAIAVVGESGVGKSFFSYYTSTLVNIPKVIWVQAQFENNPKIQDLHQAIFKAIEQEGNIDNLFRQLPKNSMIIFENIELWWKTRGKEEDLIKAIFELVEKYMDRFIFVINVQETTFKQILTEAHYSDLFLNIIKLDNVDAKHIKEIVLNRHKASGLKLHMDNKLFSEWSKTQLAYLFNKIHKITNGNIEASLQLWLTAVYRFENDSIDLKLPNIELQNLDILDIDSRVILKQFVLHKRLTLDNLIDLLQEEKQELTKKIQFLVRSGLVVKYKSYYQQNNFTKYYVSDFLHRKRMI